MMPSSPAIAVLIITCPCALGLAIPAVQTVASGAMFRTGVLLNSGDAIERLADVDRVVFDKTGTLTLPELDVTNAAEHSGRCLRAGRPACACPAIIRSPPPWRARPRQRRRWSGSRKSPVRACAASSTASRSGLAGRRSAARIGSPTSILCGIPKPLSSPSGMAKIVTSLRCGSGCVRMQPERSRRLQQRGIAVEILSGDREPAVRHAAQSLGIHEWRAGVTPADKIARIEELKRQGCKVMMVGDGMNDAPALAAAHVSMSPVSATHLSQATADLVFLGDRLAPVVAAIGFSRKALRLMRQNLWLAAGYNLLAVPLAIAGLATPLVAAAAMSGSSLLVILNALRAHRGVRELS